AAQRIGAEDVRRAGQLGGGKDVELASPHGEEWRRDEAHDEEDRKACESEKSARRPKECSEHLSQASRETERGLMMARVISTIAFAATTVMPTTSTTPCTTG